MYANMIGDDYLGMTISIGENGEVYFSDLSFQSSEGAWNEYVSYANQQELSPEQQARARENIGALAANDDIDLQECDINNVENVRVNRVVLKNSYEDAEIEYTDVTISTEGGEFDDNDAYHPVIGIRGDNGDEHAILRYIADGIQDDDAVNKKQLDAAIANTVDKEQLEDAIANAKNISITIKKTGSDAFSSVSKNDFNTLVQAFKEEKSPIVFLTTYDSVGDAKPYVYHCTRYDNSGSWDGDYNYQALYFTNVSGGETQELCLHSINFASDVTVSLQKVVSSTFDSSITLGNSTDSIVLAKYSENINDYRILEIGGPNDEQVILRNIAPGVDDNDAVTKGQFDEALSGIDAALDAIIAIQNSLMGGDN